MRRRPERSRPSCWRGRTGLIRDLDRAGAGRPHLHRHRGSGEQQALAAPLLPVPLDAKSVTAYFRGPPRDVRHARFRHLTALAAIGWWADQINDQVLRSDVYLNVGVLADRYAADSGDAVFRQVARCARAQLIDARSRARAIRHGRPAGGQPGEALPGAIRRPTRSRTGRCCWRCGRSRSSRARAPRSRCSRRERRTFAGSTMRANQAERSSRLLAAVEPRPADARRHATGASARAAVADRSPASPRRRAPPGARCRCCTTARGRSTAPRTPRTCRRCCGPISHRPTLNDQQAAFESLLRLSMAAETKEQYDDMGRLASQAFAMLGRLRGLERYPMSFYRHALDELAGTRSQDLGTLARSDPAFGAKTLATYRSVRHRCSPGAEPVRGRRARAGLLPVQDRQQPARADRALPGDAALAGGDRRLDVPARAAALLRSADARDAVRRDRPRGASTRRRARRSSASS